MKKLFILIVFTFLPAALCAADAGSRAAYSRIGFVGAKYAATGGCGSVLADDVYSIYWNPAGLVSLKNRETLTSEDIEAKARAGEANRITEEELLRFSEPDGETAPVQIGLSASLLDKNMQAYFAGAAFGLLGGVFGAGALGVVSPGVETYDETGGYLGKEYNLGAAAYFSYGLNIGLVSIGVTIKTLYEKIADYRYLGGALDGGVQVFALPFLKLAFMAQDIGVGLAPVNHRDDLNKSYDWGMPSFKVSGLITNNGGFGFALEVVKKLEQRKVGFGFGIQYDIGKYFTVAGGMRDMQFSAGAAVKFWLLDISYAFAFDNMDGGVNHVLSASIIF